MLIKTVESKYVIFHLNISFIFGLLQELVEQMISKDEKSRLSAAEFMTKYRGK